MCHRVRPDRDGRRERVRVSGSDLRERKYEGKEDRDGHGLDYERSSVTTQGGSDRRK